MNFVKYKSPRLHHIAFEVKDWAELQRGCEILQKNGIELVWGPLRHIVGHNVAAYHRNADGVRVEIFCEMDMMKDETLGYWEPPGHGTRNCRCAQKNGRRTHLEVRGDSDRLGPFPAIPNSTIAQSMLGASQRSKRWQTVSGDLVMVPVQRLGHATIETQDIERALEISNRSLVWLRPRTIKDGASGFEARPAGHHAREVRSL